MPHYTDAFKRLCKLEPRLRTLYERAKRTPARKWCGYYDQTGTGHVGLVESLETLVGFSAEKRHPDLITSAAYDVSYHVIHDAMGESQ